LLDFNKEKLTYAEYRHLVHKILLKYYKRYEPDMHYANDMVDFVVDRIKNKEKEYDSSKSKRSTYRFIGCMTYAKDYYKRVRKEQDKRFSLKVKDVEDTDNIDKQEKSRLYNIAIDIIESRMDDDIKYRYFYENVVEEKSVPTISKELNRTPAAVYNGVNIVKEQLRKVLLTKHGADI